MKKALQLLCILTFFTSSVIAQSHIPKAKHPGATAPKSSIRSKYPAPPAISSETVALSHDSLSHLKAVLVVGPIEELTGESIENMKQTASYLRSLGVKVVEVYDPDASWTNVVRAAQGAHIFLYSGHGTYLGEHERPGGFCLSNDAMISSNTIVKDLKLHKNALILFNSVCLGAGSSASDNSDIGVNKAIQRVSDYAQPFVKLGAAGYYANNYSNSMVPFLRAFFNKENIKQIYEETTSSLCHIETTQKYSYSPTFEVSVCSSTGSGFSTRTSYTNGVKKVEEVPMFKEYEIAFVGLPGFTVLDFFK
jgi:hypothetical protein